MSSFITRTVTGSKAFVFISANNEFGYLHIISLGFIAAAIKDFRARIKCSRGLPTVNFNDGCIDITESDDFSCYLRIKWLDWVNIAKQ